MFLSMLAKYLNLLFIYLFLNQTYPTLIAYSLWYRFLQVIGTAQIVLASIVELPVLIFLRETIPLFLRYLLACYARKNVWFQFVLFYFFSLPCSSTVIVEFLFWVIAAVHESCNLEMDTSVHSNASVTSFCGKNCREVAKFSIYSSFQSYFSMTLNFHKSFVNVDVMNKVVEELGTSFTFSIVICCRQ